MGNMPMTVVEKQSPYLAHPDRLADVVAAIQAMGSYRFSSRQEIKWKEILKAPRSASSWVEIFRQHPEFFRASSSSSGLHQLVLRRAQDRVFDTETGAIITIQQFFALPVPDREKISRKPLTAEQIISLIDVAVKLQNQAISRRQELRWWVPTLVGLASLVIGVVTGAAVS